MIVTSGQIPYAYESPIMPFRVNSDDEVGLSGILYEQAMFALMAERRRYAIGNDPDFYSYIHPDLLKREIEPHGSGINLAPLTSGVASAHFVDYIIDMRTALSGLFSLIALDTDFVSSQVADDYFLQLYPGTHGSKIRLFNNYVLPGVGQVLDTETKFLLGGSGVLFDVDLGEVAYQPYPHMWKFARESTHIVEDLLLDSAFPIVARPVFPAFQHTNGSLVNTNTRDDMHVNPVNEINYHHVQSGVVRIDGDPLPSGTTFLIGGQYANFGPMQVNGTRGVGGGVFSDLGRAFVRPQARASGVYRIAVRFDQDERAIPSGVISIWPKDGNYNDIGRSTTTLSASQGYHAFDDCLWVTDQGNDILNLGNGPPSGLAIASPYNGDFLWVRLADQSPTTGGKGDAWKNMVGLERLSTNNIIRVESGGTTPDGAGNTSLTFVTYNDLLNKTAEATANFNVGAGNSLACSDMLYDGASYIVLNGNLSGDDFFEFNSSFVFVRSYEGPIGVGSPPQNASRAAFFNGDYYQFGASGAFHAFEFSTSPNIASNIGNTRPINTSNFGILIGNIEQVHDVIVTTGGTHLNNGLWALVRNASDVYYLLRLEENGVDYDAIEALRLKLIKPIFGGLIRDILHMDIV